MNSKRTQGLMVELIVKEAEKRGIVVSKQDVDEIAKMVNEFAKLPLAGKVAMARAYCEKLNRLGVSPMKVIQDVYETDPETTKQLAMSLEGDADKIAKNPKELIGNPFV